MRGQQNGSPPEPGRQKAISVGALRDALNEAYDLQRKSSAKAGAYGLFTYLWDLKENALMNGWSSVNVPSDWLSELDLEASSAHSQRAGCG